MIQTKPSHPTVAALFLLFALAACTRERPETPPPVTSGDGSGRDSLIDGNKLTVGDRILFAYDSAEIQPRYRGDLQTMANWFRQHPASKAILEGHADERGTREYNLALGRKRAEAMKRALVALGVSGERLGVISYGKERPAVVGSDEAAWSQNRRAVVVAQ